MKRPKLTVTIAALVTVASLTWLLVYPRTQGWNMERARTHIAVIQPAIRADARFQNVEVAPYTKDNGCLLVHGYVTSEQALNDLRRIIDGSKSPVLTRFTVSVIPDGQLPK